MLCILRTLDDKRNNLEEVEAWAQAPLDLEEMATSRGGEALFVKNNHVFCGLSPLYKLLERKNCPVLALLILNDY